jgi:hypothetical protein
MALGKQKGHGRMTAAEPPFCGLPEGVFWRTVMVIMLGQYPNREQIITMAQMDAALKANNGCGVCVSRTDQGLSVRLVSEREADFLLSEQQGLTN